MLSGIRTNASFHFSAKNKIKKYPHNAVAGTPRRWRCTVINQVSVQTIVNSAKSMKESKKIDIPERIHWWGQKWPPRCSHPLEKIEVNYCMWTRGSSQAYKSHKHKFRVTITYSIADQHIAYSVAQTATRHSGHFSGNSQNPDITNTEHLDGDDVRCPFRRLLDFASVDKDWLLSLAFSLSEIRLKWSR